MFNMRTITKNAATTFSGQPEPSTIEATRRPGARRWLAMLGLLLLMAAPASAQSLIEQYFSINVSGNHNLAFGNVYRSSTSSVNYASVNAAEFTLIGMQTKAVRITVTTGTMVRGTAPLSMSVAQADCAYSLNNGTTWTRFSTGTLFQDTSFPVDNISGIFRGTIRIRVGGLVTATGRQQQGLYTGSITVSAVYK